MLHQGDDRIRMPDASLLPTFLWLLSARTIFSAPPVRVDNGTSVPELVCVSAASQIARLTIVETSSIGAGM